MRQRCVHNQPNTRERELFVSLSASASERNNTHTQKYALSRRRISARWSLVARDMDAAAVAAADHGWFMATTRTGPAGSRLSSQTLVHTHADTNTADAQRQHMDHNSQLPVPASSTRRAGPRTLESSVQHSVYTSQ